MAGTNIYQGQLQGPFKANENLMDLIQAQCPQTIGYILHLGIQTETHDVVQHPETLVEMLINDKPYKIEIGKTGMYEIGNTKVNGLKFLNDRDNNTIIDYTIVFKDEQDTDSTM